MSGIAEVILLSVGFCRRGLCSQQREAWQRLEKFGLLLITNITLLYPVIPTVLKQKPQSFTVAITANCEVNAPAATGAGE